MPESLQLEWKPEYCLGDALIDAQHERLFALANVILKTTDLPGLMRANLDLANYTREHFIAEENLMEARGYSKIWEHRGLHELWIQKLSLASSPIASDSEGVHIALHKLMRGWVLQHILVEDMNALKKIQS